jgi:hypothetical protein
VTSLLLKAFLSGIPRTLSISDGLSVNLSYKTSVLPHVSRFFHIANESVSCEVPCGMKWAGRA